MTVAEEFVDVAWPIEQVHEAMVALAHHARYLSLPPELGLVAPAQLSGHTVDRWLIRAAESLGLNVEPTTIIYEQTLEALRRMGPALVSLDENERHWLAVASSDGTRVHVLAPGGQTVAFPIERIRAAIASECDREGDALIEPILRAAGLDRSIEGHARQELRHQLRSQRRIRRALLVRPHPSSSWLVLARDAQLLRPVTAMLAARLLGALALVSAWAAVGSGALEGRFDPAWLAAAALLGLSQVPLSALAMAAQGSFALNATRVLKQRLFHGVMRIDRDEIRRDGVGQLVARVMESEAIESLALGGGLTAVLALIEVLMSIGILIAFGAYWVLLIVVLAVIVNAIMLVRLTVRQRAWTDARLGLTHDLVEQMVGHRTRITQRRPARWHEEEDLALVRARAVAHSADGTQIVHRVLNRAFFGLSIAALMPMWIEGIDTVRLAACVGGVLLTHGALGSLAGGIEQLVAASISASRIAPLLRAATDRPIAGEPTLCTTRSLPEGTPAVEVRGATLRYEGRIDPALRNATLQVWPNERLLCLGPSGGGKSTLAQLLAAMRVPNSGLVLSSGLDLGALGEEEWRSRTILVPQFHENHIFVKSLAFNLLMGVQWPPEDEDLEHAEMICRELGLGPLLDRMPAGIMQPVGDSGWQLSHGERSRVFLARALLCRNARVIVLDESFGALDPTTLERCVAVTLARAPALLVIAHP